MKPLENTRAQILFWFDWNIRLPCVSWLNAIERKAYLKKLEFTELDFQSIFFQQFPNLFHKDIYSILLAQFNRKEAGVLCRIVTVECERHPGRGQGVADHHTGSLVTYISRPPTIGPVNLGPLHVHPSSLVSKCFGPENPFEREF